MIRALVYFAIGFAVAAVCFNRSTAETVLSGVTEHVVAAERKGCVEKFNRDTECFQKFPAIECDAMIVRVCGEPAVEPSQIIPTKKPMVERKGTKQ